MGKKILLVEDDATLGQILKDRLQTEYEVDWATTKKQATLLLKDKKFDLLILDIGLPDGNGFDIVDEIDKSAARPFFLFLTAQSDPESRLKGYELGAEEFIPKPFHLKEVMLRVKRVLDTHVVLQTIQLPACSIDLQSYSLHLKNGTIEYPPIKDMMILKLLVEQAPKVVSRDEIINQVWGEDKSLSPRTIDNAIARLRSAISDTDESLIRSVRGVGYQWVNNN